MAKPLVLRWRKKTNVVLSMQIYTVVIIIDLYRHYWYTKKSWLRLLFPTCVTNSATPINLNTLHIWEHKVYWIELNIFCIQLKIILLEHILTVCPHIPTHNYPKYCGRKKRWTCSPYHAKVQAHWLCISQPHPHPQQSILFWQFPNTQGKQTVGAFDKILRCLQQEANCTCVK